MRYINLRLLTYLLTYNIQAVFPSYILCFPLKTTLRFLVMKVNEEFLSVTKETHCYFLFLSSNIISVIFCFLRLRLPEQPFSLSAFANPFFLRDTHQILILFHVQPIKTDTTI